MGLILLLMFGPALLFLVLGIVIHRNDNKKTAKIFFILAGVYLLISLGTCGYLLATFSLH
ncbi:hypothetical protein ACEZ3G_06610 [Maribacter algicola]|uniref:Uncharacterized protein n=1 Tax=Meishania litoralis TaxID=3434685 RepID=A0ACC7LHJ4_9FLAO